jgi:RNA polymerase sigma factor (sigma-70 family)
MRCLRALVWGVAFPQGLAASMTVEEQLCFSVSPKAFLENPDSASKAHPEPKAGASASDETARERRRLVDQLYRAHWERLCRRLRRLYGNGPPEPEDLAQAAFAKVSEMDNVEAIDNPGAYLFRAAVNMGLNAIDHINRVRRFEAGELAALGEDSLEKITPSDVLESKQALRAVESAMSRLSAKQRELIVRCRMKGETYAEISASTGWSKADISRQLNDALAILQAAADRDKDGAQ